MMLLSRLRQHFFCSGTFFLLALLAGNGCQTLFPPLPPANLQDPGWTVREGQAVWRLPKSAKEIAGDVLVATRPGGRAFVQFSKTPFPLLIGQEVGNRWEVELPAQNKHYSGRGHPPKRLIWLYLPRALAGESLPTNWTWREDGKGWRLENPASGESLEGFFNSGSAATQ